MIKKEDLIIATKVKFCNSLFSKATGLRFKWIKKDEAYVFTFDKSQKVLMDMFFVFYSIDVVFLDEKNEIVELKKRFLPFTFYASDNEAKSIIEFSKETIDKFGLKIGDKLEINN